MPSFAKPARHPYAPPTVQTEKVCFQQPVLPRYSGGRDSIKLDENRAERTQKLPECQLGAF